MTALYKTAEFLFHTVGKCMHI